jgi:hypothetical protein
MEQTLLLCVIRCVFSSYCYKACVHDLLFPLSSLLVQALKQCNASQYESRAPTATTDRACTTIIAPCSTTIQYESRAPTSTSQRVCSTLTFCTTSQVQFVAPTYSTNRFCVIAPCDTSTTYESRAPSFNVTTQTLVTRVCSFVAAVCTTNQVEIVAPNYSTNRVCRTKCSATQTTSANCPTGQVCYLGVSNIPTCFSFDGSRSATPTQEMIPGVSGVNFIILVALSAVGLIAILIVAIAITRRRRAAARGTISKQHISDVNVAWYFYINFVCIN